MAENYPASTTPQPDHTLEGPRTKALPRPGPIAGLLLALSVTAPAFPLVAVMATVVAYVSPSSPTPTSPDQPASDVPPPAPVRRAALGNGFVVGAGAWLVLGIVAMFAGTVDRANRSIYRELVARVDTLQADLRSIAQSPRKHASTEKSPASPLLLDQVWTHVRNLSEDLNRPLGGER
jgi:hypothetical protein